MSISEQDKDELLQEIQQIQNTLDLEVSNKALKDSRARNDNESSLSSENNDDIDLAVTQQEEQRRKYINDDDDDNVHSKYYVYEPQQQSDDESSNSSGFESTYSDPSSYGAENRHPPIFGHFFQALQTSAVSGNSSHSDQVLSVPGEPNMSKSISTQPSLYSTLLPSLHSKLKERITLQSSTSQSSEAGSHTNKIKGHSTKLEVVSTPKSDDGQLSGDTSIPSTYHSSRKKEKINMTNLYVERIFKNFHSKNKKPTVADVNKIDARNLKTSASIGRLENLLQLNRKYQETLAEQLNQVHVAIAKNRKAQDELLEPLESNIQRLGIGSLNRAALGRFKPYFKDVYGAWPPDNEDSIEIKKHVKVQPFSKGSKPWRVGETKALKDGIYQHNLEKRLEPLLQELKQYDKNYKERLKTDKDADKSGRTRIKEKIAEIKAKPREEILKDSYEIDYFKIAKNFLPNRDEFECQLHWCNVAHPAVNQSKFTKEEDVKILTLAKKYKNYNWEEIAKALDTRRTPVQCLQRFQRTLNKEILKTQWDDEDDKKLLEAIKKFGRNWINISNYLGNRTSDQCIHRWEKSLNPAIKRGKWTSEEDALLIEAVQMHGTKNWKTIKLCVPGRTDSQCRDRYTSSLDPSINWGPFSQEEDQKLLDLVEKYGIGKWSTIAKEFPDRKDTQVWRRFKSINSLEYQRYRRDVVWKKNSVLTYFMHRDDEKRDYDLKEMDMQHVIPSVNKFEKRKTQLAKEKLEAEGYSEEEISQELTRMTYAGDFYKQTTNTKKKQRAQQQRGKASSLSNISSNYTEEESEAESATNNVKQAKHKWPVQSTVNSLSSDLVETVKDIIGNTKNPKKVLCSSNTASVDNEGQNNTKVCKKLTVQLPKSRLIISSENINNVDRFKKQIEISIKALRDHKICVENVQSDIAKCYEKLENDPPPLVEELKELLHRAENDVKDFIVEHNQLLEQIIDQDNLDVTVFSSRQNRMHKRVPKRKRVAASHTEETPNKRKKARPKKVVEIETTPSRTKQETLLTEVKREVEVAKTVDESPLSSIDFTLENELLTEQVPPTRASDNSQPSSSPGSVVVTDQLKIFTLLLQALHVDTAGVMRSLPESHLADSIPSRNNLDRNKQFPFCYPLSPNAATLRGFRTLLLCRRRLSELVIKHKTDVGDNISGTPVDPVVFRKTPMYDALSKRFKSLFIWPAFLATFMPRYAEIKCKQKETPVKISYMNPNKRMLITSDKVRPKNPVSSLPAVTTAEVRTTTSSTSSHAITSETEHPRQSSNTVSAKDTISHSKNRFKTAIDYNSAKIVQRPLFPTQNNVKNLSTISTISPAATYSHTSSTKLPITNQISTQSCIITSPERKTVTGLTNSMIWARKRQALNETRDASSESSFYSPAKQRYATTEMDRTDESGDHSPTPLRQKPSSSTHRRKSSSKPRKTIIERKPENLETFHEVEIKNEIREDESSDIFIPRTKKPVADEDEDEYI